MKPKRKHPGRPPLQGPRRIQTMILLTEAQRDAAREIGGGSISAGVRRLIDGARNTEEGE